MKIRSLDHAALLIKDVEQSRHFYGQVLGMDEVPRPESFTFPGAWFRKGTAEIHLIGEAETGRARQVQPGGYRPDELARGYGAHLAFEVEDLAEAQQYLQEYEVPVVGGPRPRGDGVTQLYICDPDGYVVELFAWDPATAIR